MLLYKISTNSYQFCVSLRFTCVNTLGTYQPNESEKNQNDQCTLTVNRKRAALYEARTWGLFRSCKILPRFHDVGLV